MEEVSVTVVFVKNHFKPVIFQDIKLNTTLPYAVFFSPVRDTHISMSYSVLGFTFHRSVVNKLEQTISEFRFGDGGTFSKHLFYWLGNSDVSDSVKIIK